MGLFGKRREGRYYQKAYKNPLTGIKNTEYAGRINRIRDSRLMTPSEKTLAEKRLRTTIEGMKTIDRESNSRIIAQDMAKGFLNAVHGDITGTPPIRERIRELELGMLIKNIPKPIVDGEINRIKTVLRV